MFKAIRRLFDNQPATTEPEAKDSIRLDGLTLYYTPTCPFCTKVQWILKRHDLSLEKKNLLLSPAARDKLIKGGGRPTVPCLRIERNGEDRWLYESDDIIAYLKKEARVSG